MTRREQYVKRQRKWAHRRRNYITHNKRPRKTDEASNSHGGGKQWAWSDGPMQEPLKIVGPVRSTFDALHLEPHWTLTYHHEGYGKPPYVRLGGTYDTIWRAQNIHATGPLVGLHVRRVRRCGRKFPRMDGHARKIMGATWHAVKEGYYPDWDPLMRHPTAADIDNGAEYVDIDWRWGVTGEYPPP